MGMRWGGWQTCLLLALLVVACATSPLGRKQLILISDSQMDQMGAEAFQQMKSKTSIESSPSLNAYVRCVALPITEAAKGQLSADRWEIVIFRDETANAFALPGGKIGVHTGLFKVATTAGELAAVIGHEVGHVIAKHGAERVSDALAAQGLLSVTGAVTGASEDVMKLLGLTTSVGVLAFSRTQESEADLIGLDLMARAGFDPKESIELWRHMMAAAGGKSPPEILSTHPPSEKRIENLNAHIPEARPKYDQVRASGRIPRCVR